MVDRFGRLKDLRKDEPKPSPPWVHPHTLWRSTFGPVSLQLSRDKMSLSFN